MTPLTLAERAVLCWLLFPLIAIPVGLIARRRGHPSILRRFWPWVAIVPVALVPAFVAPALFGFVVAGCDVVSCWELARLDRHATPARVASTFAASLAVSGPWIFWAYVAGPIPNAVALPAMLVPAGAYLALRPAASAWWPRPAIAMSVGVALSFWIRMALPPLGSRFVLVAFSVVTIHDVMSFAVGRALGGHRPVPRLSPEKTVSGYAGGLVSAVLVAYLLYFAVPEWGWGTLTGAALLLGLSADAGGLMASAIKRRHGAKDFGTAFGLQGGVLDRLDSLLPAGSVFTLLSLAMR
jgi:phosphatidate cytidylyltransferase